jgi:hypothetical protein
MPQENLTFRRYAFLEHKRNIITIRYTNSLSFKVCNTVMRNLRMRLEPAIALSVVQFAEGFGYLAGGLAGKGNE